MATLPLFDVSKMFNLMRSTITMNFVQILKRQIINLSRKKNLHVPFFTVTFGGGVAFYTFYNWYSLNHVYAANVSKGAS